MDGHNALAHCHYQEVGLSKGMEACFDPSALECLSDGDRKQHTHLQDDLTTSALCKSMSEEHLHLLAHAPLLIVLPVLVPRSEVVSNVGQLLARMPSHRCDVLAELWGSRAKTTRGEAVPTYILIYAASIGGGQRVYRDQKGAFDPLTSIPLEFD